MDVLKIVLFRLARGMLEGFLHLSSTKTPFGQGKPKESPSKPLESARGTFLLYW